MDCHLSMFVLATRTAEVKKKNWHIQKLVYKFDILMLQETQ